MAGIEPDPKQYLDGVSLWPLLQEPQAELNRDSLFWYYPLPEKHFLGGRSSNVIRKGEYKLIEFFDDQSLELYNVVQDVGETNDLSSSMPEMVTKLQQSLVVWREDVGVAVP